MRGWLVVSDDAGTGSGEKELDQCVECSKRQTLEFWLSLEARCFFFRCSLLKMKISFFA